MRFRPPGPPTRVRLSKKTAFLYLILAFCCLGWGAATLGGYDLRDCGKILWEQ